MNETSAVVFVVEDDRSLREALCNLIRSVGFGVMAFATGQEFRASGRPDAPCCLVLDVRLPGLSGLELQRELVDAGEQIPIIFITGHGDIPMTVRAMKAGAIEFLSKPFREQDLLDAIGYALVQDNQARHQRAEVGAIAARLNLLTARERQVMAGVLAGMLNKQIAMDLGISEITVKIHRRHVMQKMQAASVVELTRMVAKVG